MYQNEEVSGNAYVWYACYGSNLCRARFMKYISSCTDPTPPVEDRAYIFPHSIYFAKSTVRWQNGAKAFLDDSSSGMSYGRIYKITYAQYEEVKGQEGADYTQKLSFEKVDGLPVYSFTDTQKNVPDRTPSREYFSTILAGLKECYGSVLSHRELAEYLIGAILPDNTFSVASVIQKNGHGMTNEEIRAASGLERSEVLSATGWLTAHGVIRQSHGVAEEAQGMDNPGSAFVVEDHPCAEALICAMMDALSMEGEEGKKIRSFHSEAETT